MKRIAIAIDGPAGSGKSTIAKMIAAKLNIIYVDTGAMYRAIALYFIKQGHSVEEKEYVISQLEKIDVELKYKQGEQQIYLNSEDVSSQIRTSEVSSVASKVSQIAEVREKLVSLQRKIASQKSVVMDGRDIGTHVLPDANPKIYLIADLEERVKRRCLEYEKNGLDYDYEKEKEAMSKRDYQDMTRENSPLKKADDAIEINTTCLTIEQTAQKIINLIPKDRD